MAGYLIYHPKRTVAVFDNRFVHHDAPRVNQDPYVWNDPFLHTYCHITQMRPEVGQTILWVSGNNWPAFDQLCCDLVFTVGAKLFWTNSNHISPDDPIVDSPRAYDEHYCWAHQHPLRRRRRFTLKADQESFQPQNAKGELIDIVPALLRSRLTLDQLRRGLRSGYGSKPMPLGHEANAVARWLSERAPVKLRGREIVECRPARGP
jgi:hypothetical protein